MIVGDKQTQKRLIVLGKFPHYDTIRIGDIDLKDGLMVSHMVISLDASEIPTATIRAYVTSTELDIYVKEDITLECRYNDKRYRLIEVEEPEKTDGS